MNQESNDNISDLQQRINASMICDRFRLRRRLQTIKTRQAQSKPCDRIFSQLNDELQKSERRVEQRKQHLPTCKYDDELPISSRREEIRKTILNHQVSVICGETGSGKSTQLPKICLDSGRGVLGVIGHTQPRRIAARSVAARIAEELQRPPGEAVGFKIRFTDSTSNKTYVKLMTDGILLAETQRDRYLEQYDTIIIDEAHERSLNIDFLMGYMKRILRQRPELRLIITSATIDAQRFADFFSANGKLAPIVEVSGRTYPVEVRYRPPTEEEDEVDWQRAAADACQELAEEGTGDILVFMPTERDIRETATLLKGRPFAGDFDNRRTEIVPLFGRLTEKEQNRVFAPHDHRRIVIATNVAESSLTVPGIVSVVDPGTARISRFSATSQVQRLPIEAISQASANQRKGRCGRIAPGVCVRLYSEADFNSRDEYTQPEIQRTNLANVILQMKTLKLGNLEEFPFIDPPAPAAIRSGLKTLFEVEAIDEQEELTEIGRAMGQLPVDPRIARMILAAKEEQCLEEVLVITSALELRDPRDRPLDKQLAADSAHEKFQHESSDFLSYLKLWDFFNDLDKKLSRNKLRKACVQNFISFNRMREWKDLHRQLRQMVVDRGLKPTDRRNDEDAIHRAILSGLLRNVAMKGDAHEYTGSGGQKLFLWPGSVAFTKKPKWIMAAELVETTKRYARCVAPVQPIWIERLADHVVKKQYNEPHWHEKSACVMAWEKVLLFGLPVVPRRRARYGHIQPKFCREAFIQHGLIEGQYETPGEFAKHNAALKEELKNWQAKLRSGQQFSGEQPEFDFYDKRLPEDIFDGPRFEKWRKNIEKSQPQLLFLTKQDLLIDPEEAPQQAAFPDKIRIGTMEVPVEYHLEPGAEDDGATLVLPPEGLNQLSPENLSWLVPGLLEEKVAALIKSLPKSLRILFVPAPETAKSVVGRLQYGQGDLLSQLVVLLREFSGEYVSVEEFELERLPLHLRFNIRVIDEQGGTIATGRDLEVLKKTCRERFTQALQQIKNDQWHQNDLTNWSFGALPQQVTLQRSGVTVVAFPMLIDQQSGVGLRLSESVTDAQFHTKRGLTRLFLLSDRKRFADQVQHFPRINQLTLDASSLPDGSRFSEHLQWMLAHAALWKDGAIPRSEQAWNEKLHKARNQVTVVVQDAASFLELLFTRYHAIRRLVEGHIPPALNDIATDLRQQVTELMAPGFLVNSPMGWLAQYPRYFEAIQHRWDKATTGGFQKDRANQKIINRHLRLWQHASEQLGTAARVHPQLVQYFFLLEEFRVSLFAQKLGTAMPVSEKRLEEIWKEIVG